MSFDADIERLARIAVDCGYRLHRDLGPGLLESAYEALMAEGLRQAGVAVERQIALPMKYNGVVVDNAFKIDLLIERSLVIELKSIERLAAVHGKQVLTYLRLMNLPLLYVTIVTDTKSLRAIASVFFIFFYNSRAAVTAASAGPGAFRRTALFCNN